MSSLNNILITSPLTKVGFQSVCDLAPGQLPALNNLIDYMTSLPDNQQALLTINVGTIQASGTITQTSTGAANDQTCTIAGVTWTAKTSATPLAAEWTRNNNTTTSATNLAAAINAYVAFTGIVTATSALGVVTVTAAKAGLMGNGLVMANVDLANTTIVSFAGGTAGTAYSLDMR